MAFRICTGRFAKIALLTFLALFVSFSKGQTNSKWFFQAEDFSKKQTNEFGLFLSNSTMNEFVRLFFGRIPKSPIRMPFHCRFLVPDNTQKILTEI